MDETVNLIFRVASFSAGDGLFLPEMGEPLKIQSLAERLLEITASDNQELLTIDFTGLRPGDKLTEDLLSPSESLEPTSLAGIHRIAGPVAASAKIDATFAAIAAQTQPRDLSALIDSIREIVPEYKPSTALLERLPSPLTRSSHHD